MPARVYVLCTMSESWMRMSSSGVVYRTVINKRRWQGSEPKIKMVQGPDTPFSAELLALARVK
jgi:hypothetical protein